MPRSHTPVYCATKAAVRSFTVSLRYQLREGNVRVIEIIPPAVQSNLHDFMGQEEGKKARVHKSLTTTRAWRRNVTVAPLLRQS